MYAYQLIAENRRAVIIDRSQDEAIQRARTMDYKPGFDWDKAFVHTIAEVSPHRTPNVLSMDPLPKEAS